MRQGVQGSVKLQNPRAKPQGMITVLEFVTLLNHFSGSEATPVPVLQAGELRAAGPLPGACAEVRGQDAARGIQARSFY